MNLRTKFNQKSFFTKKLTSIFVIMTMIVTLVGGISKIVSADTVNDNLMDISRTTTAANIKQGDTFDVTYTITPKPIPVQGQSSKKMKDIVLIIDTSGSMDWTVSGKDRWEYDYWGNIRLKSGEEYQQSRLDIMKNVAKQFIGKLQSDDKARVSLVTYGTSAQEKIKLTNVKSNNVNDLYEDIEELTPTGSTNTGDGLRVAYNKIFDNAQGQDKYIILMTDGQPEAYSTDSSGQYYMGTGTPSQYPYTINRTDRYGNQWVDPNHDCRVQALNYAKKIASEKLAPSKIKTFVVGFGSGASSKNQDIVNAAGNGAYFSAQDTNAVVNVYAALENIIAANISATAHFEEVFTDNLEVVNPSSLPNGLTVEGNKIAGDITNIYYKLDSLGQNYTADSVSFTVKYRAKGNAPYVLGAGGTTSSVIFTASNQSNKKYFPELQISDGLLNINRITDAKDLRVGDTFDVKYTITPNPIFAQGQTVNNNRTKDIVLVIDTSGSMDWTVDGEERYNNGGNLKQGEKYRKSRLDIMQTVANNFVNQFNDSNLRISLVEYSTYAARNINLTSDKTAIINTINALDTGGSKNIGDGLRAAYYTLNNSSGQDKYIILMTDGEPEAFSQKKGISVSSNNDTNYYIDSAVKTSLNNYNISQNTQTKYSNLAEYDCYKREYDDQSLKYAEKIAGEFISNSKIKTFVIGFGTGTNSDNTKIAEAAKGTYLQAQDEDGISELYDQIQKIISTNINATVHFEENLSQNGSDASNLEVVSTSSLPDGLQVIKNSDQKDIKISGDISNIFYTSSGGPNYTAEPIEFTVTYRATQPGPYILGKDNNSSFVRMQVLDQTQTKTFDEKTISGVSVPQVTITISDTSGVKDKYEAGADNGATTVNKFISGETILQGDASVNFEYILQNSGFFRYQFIKQKTNPSTMPSESDENWKVLDSDNSVAFPSEPGQYYIAFQTGEGTTIGREGFYGPFTVPLKAQFDLSRQLVGGKNSATIGEEFEVQYTIKPKDIPASTLYSSGETPPETFMISVTDLNYQDTFPAGIQPVNKENLPTVIDGQNINGKIELENIVYTLKDGVYTAEPIQFSIFLKASDTATAKEYILEGKSSFITYIDNDGTERQANFSDLTVTLDNGGAVVVKKGIFVDNKLQEVPINIVRSFDLSIGIGIKAVFIGEDIKLQINKDKGSVGIKGNTFDLYEVTNEANFTIQKVTSDIGAKSIVENANGQEFTIPTSSVEQGYKYYILVFNLQAERNADLGSISANTITMGSQALKDENGDQFQFSFSVKDLPPLQ